MTERNRSGGEPSAPDPSTYRQHGFHSFLKKPYTMGELCKALDEAMA